MYLTLKKTQKEMKMTYWRVCETGMDISGTYWETKRMDYMISDYMT